MKRGWATLMVLAALTWATGASGSTWIEDPLGTEVDAGKTLATAQVTSGAGSLTAISGVLGDPRHDPLDAVDLFQIVAAGTEITATLDSTEPLLLFLFDVDGFGVAAVDPFFGDPLVAAGLDAGGVYYLAVALSGWFPYDSSPTPLPIFDEFDLSLNTAAGALAQWSSDLGSAFDPPFSIDLTGVNPATQAVPEPATLTLLGAALTGLAAGAAWRCRRR